jgi:4-carboxymuconolactone decarboxylase
VCRKFFSGWSAAIQDGQGEKMAGSAAKDRENPESKTLLERRDFLGGAATLAGTSLIGIVLSGRAAAAEATQDRMPPIPADKMTELQKKAAEEVLAGRRGSLEGPYSALLRSPEFMSPLQKAGEYLRYNTKLGSNISEFVILLTARHWTQQFEWDAHQDLAKKAGVKPEIIAAIAKGRRPAGMSADEQTVHDFCTDLLNNQSVSDALYARAINRFGEQGVIDIIGLCGYYTLIGMVMNVVRTPLPPGKTPPLAP